MENFFSSFQFFLLIFARLTAFFVSAPVVGSSQIPARIKIILALFLSLTVYPLVEHRPLSINDLPTFSSYILSEILAGLILGFLATLIFEVLRIAGEVMGMQGGFGIVSVLDPQSEQQISLISIFLFLVSSLLFIIIGGGEALIKIVCESFFILKPGSVNFSKYNPQIIVTYFSQLLKIAFKMALPIMAFVLVNYVVMGIFSRATPRMNVFFLIFPINMMVTLILLIQLLPVYFKVMEQIFMIYFEELKHFWKFLGL